MLYCQYQHAEVGSSNLLSPTNISRSFRHTSILLNYYFSLCAILEWALTYVNLIYETSSNPLRWSEVSKMCQKSADV